jgi:hypothetical protein
LVPPAGRNDYIKQLHENLGSITEKDLARLNELKAKRAGGRLPPAEMQELELLESNERTVLEVRQRASLLAWTAFWEIAVFFGVLLVGFAYLWRRGDLAWVRSLAAEAPVSEPLPSPPAAAPIRQPAPPPAATAVHS